MAASHDDRSRDASTIPTGDEAPRTIEDIERRAAEILEQEQQALAALAACAREIAVRLPVESQLPVHLAKAAQTLDQFSDGNLKAAGVACAVGPYGHLSSAIEQYMPSMDDES